MATTIFSAAVASFLADLHVAIISIPVKNRGPLTAPIWYAYEPGGEIRLIAFKNSWRAKLLKIGVRISLYVQAESALINLSASKVQL
jgi:nitroimidazol reductase NimA-like FMN-containing flavoprotein (pyridoxamine 5'-phosphate oxidase superfamily)